jgi:hypothetical protein
LIYPHQLTPKEHEAIKRMLTGRPDQQELLNELEGAINKGAVRRTKVGYMRGLIARQREGTFDPDLGIAVHEAREERRVPVPTLQSSTNKPGTAHRRPGYRQAN